MTIEDRGIYVSAPDRKQKAQSQLLQLSKYLNLSFPQFSDEKTQDSKLVLIEVVDIFDVGNQ